MPGAAPKPNRNVALAWTVGKFAAAWGLARVVVIADSNLYNRAWFRWVVDAIYRVLAGFPAAAYQAEQIFRATLEILGWSYFTALVLATGLAPLGAMVRMIARARIRAGHADFLDRVRAWTSARPRLTRALLAAPGVIGLLMLLWPGPYELEHPENILFCAPSGVIAAWGVYGMAKKGMRSLLAPTLDGEAASTMEIGPDEIVFDAVAVTREAKAVIGGVAGLSLAVVALIASRPLVSLFHDRWPFYVMASYIALAAVAFQKASRVAVGLDGVHVRGTSRAKFYAYRDLDSARVSGGDIELVRRGRVVVRLQLHGEDATRRDAVLARITENIARVKEGRGATAAQLVASASKETLARVAHGAADYRMAALTREQLWALVEGPEIEASARKAAAEALAKASSEGERARLRVAASLCAEPHVRVALEEIARGEELDAAPGREARLT